MAAYCLATLNVQEGANITTATIGTEAQVATAAVNGASVTAGVQLTSTAASVNLPYPYPPFILAGPTTPAAGLQLYLPPGSEVSPGYRFTLINSNPTASVVVIADAPDTIVLLAVVGNSFTVVPGAQVTLIWTGSIWWRGGNAA